MRHYVKQQVGVADGTKIPVDRADGRQVNAAGRKIVASKVTGTAWGSGDTIYLGKKNAGHTITSIKACTDTSFGSATVAIGVGPDPKSGDAPTDASKYVAAQTLTATDLPTELKLKASTMDDEPGEAEHLFLTVGAASIAAGTIATFVIETVGID